MAKHILLVDGNSIAHANHNGTALTVGGMQVQAVFGFLRSLRALLQATPGDREAIVLWDGSAEFRKALDPDYKGNRAPMDAKQEKHRAAFKKQTPFIEMALKLLGVRQYRSPLLEADDLGAHFSRALAPAHQVTLVSGDKDWLQLITEDVTWFDPIRDRRCDLGNFLEFTGYHSPAAFVDGKCLQGDSSDNVSGIEGLGEKGAALLLAQWGSVQRFFDAVDAGTHVPKARKSKNATSPHPEQVLASPEGRARFARNLALMDLSRARKPEPGELILTKAPADADRFTLLCERLAFASILRDRAMFLKAFNISTTPQHAA